MGNRGCQRSHCTTAAPPLCWQCQHRQDRAPRVVVWDCQKSGRHPGASIRAAGLLHSGPWLGYNLPPALWVCSSPANGDTGSIACHDCTTDHTHFSWEGSCLPTTSWISLVCLEAFILWSSIVIANECLILSCGSNLSQWQIAAPLLLGLCQILSVCKAWLWALVFCAGDSQTAHPAPPADQSPAWFMVEFCGEGSGFWERNGSSTGLTRIRASSPWSARALAKGRMYNYTLLCWGNDALYLLLDRTSNLHISWHESSWWLINLFPCCVHTIPLCRLIGQNFKGISDNNSIDWSSSDPSAYSCTSHMSLSLICSAGVCK